MYNTAAEQITLRRKAVKHNEKWYYRRHRQTARRVHADRRSNRIAKAFPVVFLTIPAALTFVFAAPLLAAGLAGQVYAGASQYATEFPPGGSAHTLAGQIAIVSAPVIIFLVIYIAWVFGGMRRLLGPRLAK